MKKFLSTNLISLSQKLSKPLYVVGGACRNYLIDGSTSLDIDLAGNISIEEIQAQLNEMGLFISATYPRTGTIMFKDGPFNYEFTAFRKEKYVGGNHRPISVTQTDSILEDALRRDFKCNAVYYDIFKGEFVDPLGGINDIREKILDTVKAPDKVFSSDGLRLMRLARFCGELNFRPTYAVMESAKRFADNILDISSERVFAELKMILNADSKYPFSDKYGHYSALKVLDYTKVLDRIMPELTEGRGMVQRADFHKYDVLEHSLRAVMYAKPQVRLGALLHDVGKPLCFKRDGYYYLHFAEGEKQSERILKRLKADKQTIKKVKFLVREHMVDLDCSMKESRVRRFIQKNYDQLQELLMVKQADFRASLEVEDTAPTLIKWNKILEKMQRDGTPFSLKDLKISAKDLMEIGYQKEQISKELNALLEYAVLAPEKNENSALMIKATKDFAKKLKQNA